MPVNWEKFKPAPPETYVPLVVQAFKKAGFSDAGAKVLAAEVGRENDFKPSLLFGTHSDPKNKQKNVGIFSWQGDRATKLITHLKEQGLVADGKIVQGRASLDAMAEFVAEEMGEGLKTYLQQPTVDYQTAVKRVGKEYIKWRFDDPEFAEGHKRRDAWYEQAGGTQHTIDWSVFTPIKETIDWSVFTPLQQQGANDGT